MESAGAATPTGFGEKRSRKLRRRPGDCRSAVAWRGGAGLGPGRPTRPHRLGDGAESVTAYKSLGAELLIYASRDRRQLQFDRATRPLQSSYRPIGDDRLDPERQPAASCAVGCAGPYLDGAFSGHKRRPARGSSRRDSRCNRRRQLSAVGARQTAARRRLETPAGRHPGRYGSRHEE